MKKSVFLIVCLLTMAHLLTACSKETVIRCSNCAATVPDDSFYCPNCGTAFFQNSSAATTAPTETTITTESSTQPATTPATAETPAAQTSPVVQTPPENTHTHSFSAATCLAPQTCACGATTGGLGDHDYFNCVCVNCGIVDKANAYRYFTSWIIKNSVIEGDLCRIDIAEQRDMYSLVYDTAQKCAYISLSFESEGEFYFSILWLNNYNCGTNVDDITLEGYLNPATFTENTSITLSDYSGDASLKNSYLDFTNSAVHSMLVWLDSFLYFNDVGITLGDLGFTAY